MSKSLQLDKEEMKKILTAFAWSLGSTILAGIAYLLADPSVELPMWLIPLVPIINSFIYGASKFIKDNR